MPADQLMVWGWRVPFLLTVFTTPIAVYLRMHMPEPFEFLEDKQQQVAQRVASTAASRVARSFTRSHTAAPGSRTGSMQLASSLKLGSFKAANRRVLTHSSSSQQLQRRLMLVETLGHRVVPGHCSLQQQEVCVRRVPSSCPCSCRGL